MNDFRDWQQAINAWETNMDARFAGLLSHARPVKSKKQEKSIKRFFEDCTRRFKIYLHQHIKTKEEIEEEKRKYFEEKEALRKKKEESKVLEKK